MELERWRLWCFSTPMFALGMMRVLLTVFLAKFYSDTVQIRLSVLSSLTTLLVIVYALCQPFFGWLAERHVNTTGEQQDSKQTQNGKNCFSKWRITRRLLIGLSTPPLAAMLFCLFNPPTESRAAERWAGWVCVLLGLCWGCLEVSINTMATQLCRNYHARTRLYGILSTSFNLGILFGSLLPGAFDTGFDSDSKDLDHERRKYMYCGLINALVFLVAAAVLLLAVRDEPKWTSLETVQTTDLSASKTEGKTEGSTPDKGVELVGVAEGVESSNSSGKGAAGDSNTPATAVTQAHPTGDVSVIGKRPLSARVKEGALKLWVLFLELNKYKTGNTYMWAANVVNFSNVVNATMLPYYTAYVVQSRFAELWSAILYFSVAIASIPLWLFFISPKLEKKTLYIICLRLKSVFLIFLVIFVDSQAFGVFYSLLFLAAINFGGLMFSPSSLQPDVLDYDRLVSGQRRAGLFSGWWGLTTRICGGIGFTVSIRLLERSGYKPNSDEQSEATLNMIRFLFGGVPIVCCVISSIIMIFYPITRQKHKEINEAILSLQKGLSVTDPITGRELHPPNKSLAVGDAHAVSVKLDSPELLGAAVDCGKSADVHAHTSVQKNDIAAADEEVKLEVD